MSLEFVVPILCIVIATKMSNAQLLQQRIDELMELEEDNLVARFIQLVEKQ